MYVFKMWSYYQNFILLVSEFSKLKQVGWFHKLDYIIMVMKIIFLESTSSINRQYGYITYIKIYLQI